MNALYVALRHYQLGEFKDECIAVGILPADLSAVFLAVEKTVFER